MALLTLTEVAKTYDANRPLLRDVSITVRDEDRIGLIGPNGTGKSTLLRIMAGVEVPDAGERIVRRGLRIGFLEQEPVFPQARTVRELVHEGLGERNALLAELAELDGLLSERVAERAPAPEMARLLRRQELVHERLEAAGGHDVEHRVEATIDGVGLHDPEARAETLSGGEARRVALAQLLIGVPDLLLLDEPTNHLDAFVIAWLEERLARLRVPLVLVTHDRYLLDRVVNRIVEIDRGSAFATEGGYSRYVVERADRLASEERAERARQNVLRRETAWMRRGPPARTGKAKARVSRYAALVDDAPLPAPEELELAFPASARLGTRVLELRGVSHRYGAREVLPPLDLELAGGMRLGVVGPNGAGKSTLLQILLGRLTPTAGEVSVGETVRFATVDQKRADLDASKTVVREVAGESDHVAVAGRRIHVAGFLDRFLFPGAKKDVLIRDLSGGERGRVLLAKLMLRGGNVLVLDEPTNDLDLSTLRALEEALLAFSGAVVVVSHDRWFLDRVATHVLHLDGRGTASFHTGGVTDLFERLARDEPEPARARSRSQSQRKERGQGRTPALPKTGAGDRAQEDAGAEKKRLAPWERRELEEVTERIAVLESELAELDRRLADPELYTRASEELRAVQTERGSVHGELERVMSRWEELAERAD